MFCDGFHEGAITCRCRARRRRLYTRLLPLFLPPPPSSSLSLSAAGLFPFSSVCVHPATWLPNFPSPAKNNNNGIDKKNNGTSETPNKELE